MLFGADTKVDMGRMIALIRNKPKEYKLDGGDKLRFFRDLSDPAQRNTNLKTGGKSECGPQSDADLGDTAGAVSPEKTQRVHSRALITVPATRPRRADPHQEDLVDSIKEPPAEQCGRPAQAGRAKSTSRSTSGPMITTGLPAGWTA